MQDKLTAKIYSSPTVSARKKKKKKEAFREISLISDSWLRRSRKGLGHKGDMPGSLGIMVTRGTSPLEEMV